MVRYLMELSRKSLPILRKCSSILPPLRRGYCTARHIRVSLGYSLTKIAARVQLGKDGELIAMPVAPMSR